MESFFQVLQQTWQFYWRHLGVLFVTQLPLMIPIIWHSPVSLSVEFGWWLALTLICTAFSQSILILYLGSFNSHDELNFRRLCSKTLTVILPLIALNILWFLAVIGGLFLFILPMFFVFARLSFASFYCVLEKQNPLDAFKNSWRNTKELQWLLLLGAVMFWIISSVPSLFLEQIFGDVLYWNTSVTWGFRIFELAIQIPFSIFCYRYFLYKQATSYVIDA